MPARRLFAWSIYLALTAPIGLLAHFVFEAYSRRDGAFSPAEPDHLALLAIILGCIATVTVALRHGTRDERRARLAALRASMPRGAALVFATTAVQLVVAGATLAREGVALDPARVGWAAAMAIVTALLGAWVFRCLEDALLATAAALAAPWVDVRDGAVLLDFAAEPPAVGHIARRLHGGRSPPLRT